MEENQLHSDIGEVQLDDELEQFDYIICGNVPLEEMYEAGFSDWSMHLS